VEDVDPDPDAAWDPEPVEVVDPASDPEPVDVVEPLEQVMFAVAVRS
jgi:hypothetical protein